MTFTLTAIVPAHNEEAGLPATLDSLIGQTEPADEIIVVDDGSTDRTGEVAATYGVTVLRPPRNLGSKAKAQNHALAHCTTDLVLAVDADTVLAPDYIEKIKPVFADPEVTVAAGNVQTRFTRTPWERGRSVEYLFGFHWNRPIQQAADSPVVCSGCCSVFRRSVLAASGGFPERTIVEDMDYCVPVDHEILTRDGFVTYDRLTLGDDVLALDHETGVFEWVPLEGIAVFDYDGEVHTWAHGTAGPIAFTPNHRWPVITPDGERRLLPAHAIERDAGGRDGLRIPLTAGYHAAGPMSPRLAGLLGDLMATGLTPTGDTDWHAPLRHGDAAATASVALTPADRRALLDHVPTAAHLPGAVGRLSTAAAAAMFRSLVARLRPSDGSVPSDRSAPPDGTFPSRRADPSRRTDPSSTTATSSSAASSGEADPSGTRGPRGEPEGRRPAQGRGASGLHVLPHGDHALRDAVQMLALMVGRTSVAGPGGLHINSGGEDDDVRPGLGVTRRPYRGKVWCPKTKHGTWVVRHGGVVAPTGNTWSQQIAGNRAVYVSDTVAWAADPETLTFLRKQVWRWMSGFFQNVRIHGRRLVTRKPMLALWVGLAVLEILLAPLWWGAPVLLIAALDRPAGPTMGWWLGAELALTIPPLVYAARRRRLRLRDVLGNVPFVYLTKLVNLWYAWKALIVELALVPLRLADGLTVYEKGRPDAPPDRPPAR